MGCPIPEEERHSNPVLKVVFTRLRNLKKKLAQIEHLSTLDWKSLKPGQREKLAKREELLREVKRQEDFAQEYKNIMIEGGISDDRT